MTNETVLSIRNLEKRFGSVQAVRGVSLDVRRGEVFGFLGPNGAGKTTTIGMVLGLIHATGGQVEVLGSPVRPGQTGALREVGALVGASASLVPYLTARENLRLVARLHPEVDAARIEETLALIGLADAADRKAGQFSTGMKQRLGLGMALLHRPELLILDEPTNGMDPAGMREVRNLLRKLADDGVTVFLSSHLLHEIEQVCDRVAVLNRGAVVATGAVADLIGGQAVVRVRADDPAAAARVLAALSEQPEVELNGVALTIRGLDSKSVIVRLVEAGIVPSEVTVVQADLESLFMELTQQAA